MKYRLGLSAALIVFLTALISCSALASAEDSPTKTIQLNLNQPQVEEEPDNFSEKYQQVMQEITISEEAAAVVDQIKAAVEDLKDLAVDINITEIRERRNEEVVLHLMVSIEHKLARIEFNEPSAVRGMILVANQAEMQVHIFQPVTNVIVVRGLEDASKEALVALSIGQDLTQLTSYFDFSQYNVDILDKVELEGGVTDYLLQVDAPEEEIWYVRVRDDSWFPHEISVYEGEVLQGTMRLSNVELDPGLSVEEITCLPDAKIEKM
jgi:outer membrane lipoprotein-sorting protein